MTDEEIARTLRDLSHHPRVVGKSAPGYGRLSDLLRFVANEIEALGTDESGRRPDAKPQDYEVCGFPWRHHASGLSFSCVRIAGHGRGDGPRGGGGHTALQDWAGR